MSVHQGERLDLFLRVNNIKRGEFYKRVGISRSTLYNILRDKVIKKEYLDAIRKAGYDFDSFVQTNVHDKIIHTSPSNSSDLEKESAEKDKIIAHLKTIIDAQDRIIKWMEHFMNKPRKSIAASVKSKN